MSKISKSQFLQAVIEGDNSLIGQALAEGMPIAIVSEMQEDGRRPAIEFPSFTDNYGTLHLLWQHKAVATTPYIKLIFEKFDKGQSPQELYDIDKMAKENEQKKVKLDLTNKFAASKIKVERVHFAADDNGTELNVHFKPFLYDNSIHKVILEFVTDDILELKPNSILHFEGDYLSSSMYIDNVHNPVDLRTFKTGNIVGKKMAVELELFFDFQFERTPFPNETVTIKHNIKI
jgi:hypothetical protein